MENEQVKGHKDFQIFATIGEGAKVFEGSIVQLMLPLLVFWVVMLFFMIIPMAPFFAMKGNLFQMTFSVVQMLIYSYITLGLTNICFKVIDRKPISVADLFNRTDLFLNYLLCALLFGIVLALGYIALIIPGIIFTVKFLFSSYLVVDKEIGPVDAMKRSWEITNHCSWRVLGLLLVLVLINLVAIVLFLIPYLFTFPMTVIIIALTARKLQKETYAELVVETESDHMA
jgi:hypothetical protein